MNILSIALISLYYTLCRNGDVERQPDVEEPPPVVNEQQVEKNEDLIQASSAHRSNWTLVVKVNACGRIITNRQP